MPCLFVAYLLGVWLLLSQFPSETTAGLLRSLSDLFCNNPLVNKIESKCMRIQIEDLNAEEDLAPQQRGLSEFPDFFSHTDSEALNILMKFIPESQQELKAILSDKQSLLRTLQHPKDRGVLLDTFVKLCCRFNCVKQAKMLICDSNPLYNLHF